MSHPCKGDGAKPSLQSLAWGTLFVDIDNDGWLDLFMADGHVYPELDNKGLNNTFREREILYWEPAQRQISRHLLIPALARRWQPDRKDLRKHSYE